MFQQHFSLPDLKALWRDKESRRLFLSALFIAILALGSFFILWGPSRGEEFSLLPEEETENTSEGAEEMVVDIAGGVIQPGVYRLPKESIVEDIIIMAGGFSKEADVSTIERTINRAELLENHSKIYIPKIGDQLIASLPALNPSSSSSASSYVPGSILVNINSASPAELDTLPGIGPATAQNIIDFRKLNGPFTKKEDLKLVPGIGESKYEKIKELIAV